MVVLQSTGAEEDAVRDRCQVLGVTDNVPVCIAKKAGLGAGGARAAPGRERQHSPQGGEGPEEPAGAGAAAGASQRIPCPGGGAALWCRGGVSWSCRAGPAGVPEGGRIGAGAAHVVLCVHRTLPFPTWGAWPAGRLPALPYLMAVDKVA